MPDDNSLDAISKRLQSTYVDYKKHLYGTVKPRIKYWQGGSDPLESVQIFLNEGDPSRGVPEHWHYVSSGFTDLHGDGRVHEATGQGEQSGYGFELTFRLKRSTPDEQPMKWPALMINSLARYVFRTGNSLNCGDHIPWHKSWVRGVPSKIQYILLAEDPQLGSLQTRFGDFQFRQIVGVTEAELKAAQRWKGGGIVNLLSQVPEASGPYLLTDMSRQISIFNMHPQLVQTVVKCLEKDGCNLGNVTAACSWMDPNCREAGTDEDEEEERDLSSVQLTFDLAAAELLPLVAKARLLQNKCFVFQNVADQVIVFVPFDFDTDMVLVDTKRRLRAQKKVLQIQIKFSGLDQSYALDSMYCTENFVDELAIQMEELDDNKNKIQLPMTIQLENPRVSIQVVSSSKLQAT